MRNDITRLRSNNVISHGNVYFYLLSIFTKYLRLAESQEYNCWPWYYEAIFLYTFTFTVISTLLSCINSFLTGRDWRRAEPPRSRCPRLPGAAYLRRKALPLLSTYKENVKHPPIWYLNTSALQETSQFLDVHESYYIQKSYCLSEASLWFLYMHLTMKFTS